MVAAARLSQETNAVGPFATAALELHACGLAPIPLGGDDGKVPLVRWKTWNRQPGKQ